MSVDMEPTDEQFLLKLLSSIKRPDWFKSMRSPFRYQAWNLWLASVNRLFCCVLLGFRGLDYPTSCVGWKPKFAVQYDFPVSQHRVRALNSAAYWPVLVMGGTDGVVAQRLPVVMLLRCCHRQTIRQCDVIDWCWTTARTTTVKASIWRIQLVSGNIADMNVFPSFELWPLG